MSQSYKQTLGIFLVLTSLLLSSVSRAQSIDVQAGWDLFNTSYAAFNFGPALGIQSFESDPIHTFDFGGSIGSKDLANANGDYYTDTIVQRPNRAEFGFSTPIVIQALSLISDNAIAGDLGGTAGDYVKTLLISSDPTSFIQIKSDGTFSSTLKLTLEFLDEGTNQVLAGGAQFSKTFTSSGIWFSNPGSPLLIPLIQDVNLTSGPGSDFFVRSAYHDAGDGTVHTVRQVPEPATLFLFALGAGLLGISRRKTVQMDFAGRVQRKRPFYFPNKTTGVTTMATHSKLFKNALAVFFGLMLFSIGQVQAAYVAASSDMVVNNLGFVLADPNAQLQWTDVWYGDVRAHAADSDSAPVDDSNSILGNNTTTPLQAVANTAHVSSWALYNIVGGDQIGIDPAAGVTGTTHSNLHLERPNMQADGFAVSAFDNFFMLIDPNDPTAQGQVQVDFLLDYSGTIFGTADAGGTFKDITHIATLRLLDLQGNLLNGASYALFQDSISGSNTTITHTNHGTLDVSFLLDLNTTYWLSAEADAEIYGYTPEPTSLPLILFGLAGMHHFRRR